MKQTRTRAKTDDRDNSMNRAKVGSRTIAASTYEKSTLKEVTTATTTPAPC